MYQGYFIFRFIKIKVLFIKGGVIFIMDFKSIIAKKIGFIAIIRDIVELVTSMWLDGNLLLPQKDIKEKDYNIIYYDFVIRDSQVEVDDEYVFHFMGYIINFL